MSRKHLPTVFLALCIIVSTRVAAGDTLVTGTISTSTTWTLANSPYVVTGTVFVTGSGNPVLTIQPGVTVKFNAGTGLTIGGGSTSGALQAVGTSTQQIIFTANSSTNRGFWTGINFGSCAGSSAISYATVQYGGTTLRGGITTGYSCAPSLSNLTVQNNAWAGLYAAATSPVVTNSTFSSNDIGIWATGAAAPSIQNSTVSGNTTGLYVDHRLASPSLTTVTFTGNTGNAIQIAPDVTLGAVSGVTATLNGVNGIAVLGTTAGVDVNTRWRATGLPYVITASVVVSASSSTAPTPTLTIDPGVNVLFNSAKSLTTGGTYAGTLSAIGTAAQPITFTANGSTSPGFWSGIRITREGTTSSVISYAAVTYATTGIAPSSGTPVLDHLTVANNSGFGISGTTPTVHNCSILSNGGGGVSAAGDARLNWWGNASGPSGSGPGTGQSVGGGALYDPWLAAAPSSPQFIQSFSLTNPTFNPTQQIYALFAFTTPLSGNWTLTFKNSGGTQVRQFTGTGTTGTVTWDGTDGSTQLATGTYTYTLQSIAGSQSATPATGRATISSTPLALSGLTRSGNGFFSPNGDGVQDTVTLSATTNYTVSWTVAVNSGSTTVRTLSGSGTSIAALWDGKNGSGVVVADGLYSLNITATAGTASVSDSRTVTVDDTLPTAAITDPSGSGAIVSNVYRNVQNDISIVGTASDTNLSSWSMNYCFGPPGCSPEQLFGSGTANVTASQLAVWHTLYQNGNGAYTLHLRVTDKAGNHSDVTYYPVTVEDFSASIPGMPQLNPITGPGLNITSIVPFSLTSETINITSIATGQTLRTIVLGSRAAGTYTDAWDGKDGTGRPVPEGGYKYTITVSDGIHTFTWDPSWQSYGSASYSHPTSGSYNPFNNVPVSFSYTLSQPCRSIVAIGPIQPSQQIFATCSPPNICLVNDVFQSAGTHYATWAGVDSTGALRPDINAVGQTCNYNGAFPGSAIAVFGTALTISNLRLTPALFGPMAGTQDVAFTLALPYGSTAALTVKFTNQASLSVLRTITLPAQAAGTAHVTWDGRADNGMLVAPGFYTVTVQGTDALGNAVSPQVLTNIVY